MPLTAEAALALAPDSASAKAAQGLTARAKWVSVGEDETALWGECSGSGAKPYQTQIDQSGPTFKCSCPSRKFPCKHGLALLLLRAQDAAFFTATTQPAWVSEWLNKREEKAVKKKEKLEQAPAPIDSEAAEKTAQKRWARIDAAAADLQRWLIDQIDSGLAAVNASHRDQWHTVAARLVDAQAPGLAQRVREASALIAEGEHWPEKVLSALGVLQLICDAVSNRQQLSDALKADLRATLGWPLTKAEVILLGTAVTDQWLVLGQTTETLDNKLFERRVWLQGLRTGQRALLLDHTYGGTGFEQAWQNHIAAEGQLIFYPGAAKYRALAGEFSAFTASKQFLNPTNTTTEWQTISQRLAACVWLAPHPLVFTHAQLARHLETTVLKIDNTTVPVAISETDVWQLLALTGGSPAQFMGEWDGNTLLILAVRSAEGDWQKGVD